MDNYLLQQQLATSCKEPSRFLSGGRTFSSCKWSSDPWPAAPLALAIHSFYGMTIGLSPALKIDFLSFILFLARKSKGSIRHFLDGELNKILSLPLSVQASNQIISLMELLEERNWDLSINNKWTYT